MSDPYYEQTLAAVGEAVFLLPSRQYVTYIPASGSRRRIEAVVSYDDEDDAIADVGEPRRPAATVLVRNSATDGIASGELDTGGDKLEISIRTQNKPIHARIVELLAHDAGFCKLQVQ